MRHLITVLTLVLSAGMVAAHDYSAGGIKIEHPIANPTTSVAMSGVGYMTITNTGTEPDVLQAIEADFPRVMMHDNVMNGDVATMKHMMSIDILPGQTVMFAPGGLHVMFMGLNGDPFELGEKIPATLVFKNAGRVDIEFMVEQSDDDADHK